MKRIGPFIQIVLTAALVSFGFSFTPPEAAAISRYNSTSMSCASIRSVIRSEGAVILRWRSGRLYNRFVSSSRYCDPGQRAVTTYVPSAGGRSCAVRKCERCDFDDDDLFIRRC